MPVKFYNLTVFVLHFNTRDVYITRGGRAEKEEAKGVCKGKVPSHKTEIYRVKP